jgi:thiol:disulfide interchange protein DsbD
VASNIVCFDWWLDFKFDAMCISSYSLKVLSFVSMGGDDNSKIRNHALSFVGGVMSTFLSIATALIIIRSTGSMIGWGYQLQSPVVVGILTLIMLGIGLILLTNINFAAGLTT